LKNISITIVIVWGKMSFISESYKLHLNVLKSLAIVETSEFHTTVVYTDLRLKLEKYVINKLLRGIK